MDVRKGLIVWLDAAKLPDGRAALSQAAIEDGDPVAGWPDASGAGRHVTQESPDARPTYREVDGFRAVRFDGVDDFLSATGIDRSAREVTVFVVAASYSSPGWFTGYLALSGEGKSDFQSGLNLDQGVGSVQRLDVLNVEGAGSQGMRNLLNEPKRYGQLLRICVTSAPGENGCSLRIDDASQGARDRDAASTIEFDRVLVGARYYEVGAAPFVRGFFDGDIAEVLIYDRVLADAERDAVEKYLADKYEDVGPLLPPNGPAEGTPLVRVENPPPVQFLVPGFVARRLPIELPNVNNVLYRPDGKLVGLGYDGNVWLLSDTDGDGLEEKADLYWDNQGRLRAPIGMALTPPGYPLGEGVFVAGKGKCSLLLDQDGDGVAEKETIVAEGWKELPHGVDALGVAVDPEDHSVYFGLGSQNFTDPYDAKQNPRAVYPLDGERGTILRVAPDFSKREVVATGIRFPVAIRFNAAGDLFCTDQEGATWVPNGNPFDELLHIAKGRHYGFPARHPVHLPEVIDEPSVFDYVPQHQSTCGLNFNEPVNGGPTFGPAWWRGDAIVSGYSRGKLYRTSLVPTPLGYVAKNQALASFSSLVCDACVSPAGDLVVACHSGAPDWGSGPAGKGTLYKLVYAQPELPQPVLAWANGPREVRVAFDRPLTSESLAGVQNQVRIEYGRYVAPGDRFESLWPGYQVVRDQQRSPRFELPVRNMQITADGRTLILATDPHPEAASYALTLPGLGRTAEADPSRNELSQVPETDLGYDLGGVEATWKAKEGAGARAAWLPHADLAVAEELTRGSAEHESFFESIRPPGKLTLKTRLNLRDMLRPAVQPGSKLDFEQPPETVTLLLRSKQPFRAQVGAQALEGRRDGDGRWVASVELTAPEQVAAEIAIATGETESNLSIAWRTDRDPRERPLQLRRFLLPWAPASDSEPPPAPRASDSPELAGGNWQRGRAVFFSEAGQCAKCHSVRGEGGTIGPDLSNLPHRDYASVLRDVNEPSFALNPDYISQVIALHDGRVLTGVVRTEGDRLVIADQKGLLTSVAKADVELMRPSGTSAMPEDLAKQLAPDRLRDLLTFLLTEPPRMPEYGRGPAPEPRSQAELAAVLAGAPDPPAKPRPIRVTLVAGRKDHGPGEHDYPAWKEAWSRLLAMSDGVDVSSADEWPSKEQLQSADVLVFYQQGKWTPERARDLDAYLERGGGAVYIHYAVDGGADAPGFAQRIGLAWQGGRSKFRHGPLDLGFDPGEGHPIARNFDKVDFHDESYWNLVGDAKRITLLATGKEEGVDQPLFWTMQPGKGRVFVSIPGHFAWTFDDPLFRILLLRGIAWAADEPVDRLNPLVVPGARIAPATE
ncbi:MAG TPA: ThuA domain-containing protein [Pirellulaceae bacterium]|jgi:putative heme-binding domain-containing protein|nr:ThuA domain-containing protein [Pirellulaceae bacterium]